MEVPKTVLDLVERFDYQYDTYKQPAYNETQVRREFIDPFFEALGWDIHNTKGYAEQYKEVIHEDAIKIGSSTRAPDYSFRLGGRRLFFLEAKKPSVNLKEDQSPAYQLRRYAWTAKLPISILTDFEEFIVYDTRVKPDPNDKSSTARVKYISFREYPRQWNEIYDLFSPQAIQKGALDKYVQASGKKRGTAEVDDAFLAEIEEWRDLLARNIALRNPGITQRELNFSVQTTIDRIVFLRICEDRAIENYGQLQALLNGDNIYARLRVLYERADERYNSGLFHFHKERDRAGIPDTLTLGLTIDDKALKAVIKRLYYPESPYEFSVLPAEILGQVYERFLGSVIRLTTGGQAKVEQKPEVRKAGGVYYTPSYIVDYIVKHTVGKLLEGKAPQEVAGVTETWRPSKTGRPLAILDPACGSGSFLLGAYQYLLDWHLEYYAKDPAKWSTGKEPRIYQHHRGGWRLATSERKRILLANIYGVDIDPQAVEVTKLSLLLRVLEGENADTLQKQYALFHERALPDLANNIKCGNSLIGPDFYQGKQLDALDEEETYRINAFDWYTEFPHIMGSSKGSDKGLQSLVPSGGGFDVIIGNPPYVRQEGLGEFKEYFQHHYRAYTGTADLYVPFIEKGISLLRENGLFSYIVANKWMRANYGKGLRQWLMTQCIEEIVDFGDLPVFTGATTYPCILRIARKHPQKEICAFNVKSLEFVDLESHVAEHRFPIAVSNLQDDGWSLSRREQQALMRKIREKGIPLGEYVGDNIFYGIKTGLNEAFVIDIETRDRLIAKDPKSTKLFKPFLAGRDVKRYVPPKAEKFLILIPRGWTTARYGTKHDAWESFLRDYPAIASHLQPFAQAAHKRYDKGEYWWELRTCDYYGEFEKPKIIVPAIVQKASYCYDSQCHYSNDKTSIIASDDLYLLGILNSPIPDIILRSIASTKQGGYYEYKPMYITQLPIPSTMRLGAKGKSRHDKMVSLVQRMLDLHKQLQSAKTEHERGVLERQITATDNEIDHLVYELYDLTPDEIAIVEESTSDKKEKP